MDRAEIQTHIENLGKAFRDFTVDQCMSVIQLELLLMIFDTLDKMPGMLESIDNRLDLLNNQIRDMEKGTI